MVNVVASARMLRMMLLSLSQKENAIDVLRVISISKQSQATSIRVTGLFAHHPNADKQQSPPAPSYFERGK